MTAKRCILILTTSFIWWNCVAQDKGVRVADSAQYDPGFVKYWDRLGKWGVEIVKDSIIVNGETNEPILIPTDLPLNETVEYESQKEGVSWTLNVKRVSYTNVEFWIHGSASDSTLYEGEGVAILSPSFYLACAGTYEPSEAEVYGMNNYPFQAGDFDSGVMLIPVGTNEMIEYSHIVNGEEVVLQFVIKKGE